MKIVCMNESIKTNQAYMIRNDGKIIEVSQHPQILNFEYSNVQDLDNTMLVRCCTETVGGVNSILWLYRNTQYDSTREKIQLLIGGIIGTFFVTPNYASEIYCGDGIEANEDEIKLLLLNVRKALNQEFLRVRVSGKYGFTDRNNRSIYFRVSSTYFNWFDIIWKFVYDNKSFLSDVTIVTDEEQTGRETYYSHCGVVLNHIPTDEFINLSGNPEIESLRKGRFIKELQEGNKSIFEIFNSMNYASMYQNLLYLKEDYDKQFFIKSGI